MNILYLNNYINVGGVTKCILTLSKDMKYNHNITIATAGGPALDEIHKLNLKYYKLVDLESKSPINIIRNILTIRKIVKKEKIDIIHSHHRMTTLLSKILSIFQNVKVIHTQHLCIEDKYRLTKLALKGIPTITVSNAAKRILESKSNLNSDLITTIYNTVDLEVESMAVDPILLDLKNQGYFIVGQVSRMIHYKGIYDFIEIAKRTIQSDDRVRFVFIGDGPELQEFKNKIADNNLESYVYALGNKKNVITQLKYIDLFLLCSYIEGLPLSPLEAFSQAIPVIATNIDGTNEEVINGVNGYLIEPKNIELFTDKILYLLNNRDEYSKFKANALNSFNTTFSKKDYIEQHLKFYDCVLKN